MRMWLSQSLFHAVAPVFDRVFPSAPFERHRTKLAILMFDWRDVKHPQAGGGSKYVHEVGKLWSAQGHYVEWVTAHFKDAPAHETIDGVNVTRLGNAATVYPCAALKYVRSMRNRFDVIVDSENGIPFFSPLFSFKPKILLMHHVHRDVFLRQLVWPLSWIFVAIEAWLMPFLYRNSVVVAVSGDTVDEMRRYRMTRRVPAVVHPGVDASLKPGTKAPDPTICYVGRLAPYKRLDLLIGAMPQVLVRHPRARLVIAGRGPDEARLRKVTENLGIGSAVDFRGFVSEDEKRSIYQSAWVCGVPSAKEGFCLTALEANACGTPVVAFDIGGLRTAVPHGEGGLLLPEGSNFADGICKLLDDDLLRAHLAASAVANGAKYTWASTARELMRVIRLQLPE
jgi:glycosyltransferase involved in cell wall biosynthesis